MSILELFGYVSSILIAVSLMMSNIFRLRVINLIGAFAFAVYGALIGAAPVAVVNGFIAAVDVYYLYKMSRRREYFRTLEIVSYAPFLEHFMQFRAKDIAKFFPDFEWEKEKRKKPSCVFLLRDTTPVGIFIYQVRRNSVVVKVDYVIPEYRDMESARFLFMILGDRFHTNGQTEYLVESVRVETHRKYLVSLGFESDPARPDAMVRAI